MRNWNPVLQDGSLNWKGIESPLGFRNRSMVRVETDIFSDQVKEETIRAVFAIMGQFRKCTFLLKTSHPWRPKSILDRWHENGLTLREGHGAVLPNVWIGTVVTNQYEADSLLPILVRTRAAKRWVSLPKLFDPLYLTSLKDLSGDVPEAFPKRWEDYAWPEWVPADVRKRIEEFWSPAFGRSPREWMMQGHDRRDAYRNCTPALGTVVAFDKNEPLPWVLPVGTPGADGRGRYVHCWNNMGRIIQDDGTVLCASVGGRNYLDTWLLSDPDFYKRKKIDFVVLEEKGNSEVLSSIKKECLDRNVPCLDDDQDLVKTEIGQ